VEKSDCLLKQIVLQKFTTGELPQGSYHRGVTTGDLPQGSSPKYQK